MKLKCINYTALCFLLLPFATSANKYGLRGVNTKAEVEALGIRIKNRTLMNTLNQQNQQNQKVAKVHRYEIWTTEFGPCKPVRVGVTLFKPPKGILFSAEIDELSGGIFRFQVSDVEADGLVISITCPNRKNYSFALVD